MVRIAIVVCLMLTACVFVLADQEGSNLATTQKGTSSNASASPADSQPASLPVSQAIQSPILTGTTQPMKAPAPDFGLVTIRVAPKLSAEFIKQNLGKSGTKVLADPETLKKVVEEEISKSAKANGKTIEEFLKKVDGTTVASKIDLLAKEAKQQIEAGGNLTTFEKQLEKCYEKDADEIVVIAKEHFPDMISVSGHYYLAQKKWQYLHNDITLKGSHVRSVPTKIRLAFTADLSQSIGGKLVVPVSEILDVNLNMSLSESGEPLLTDETSTTTDVTVNPVATIKFTSTIAEQKGLALKFVAVPIAQDLGAVKAVLTRGQVLPTKVVEIDTTSHDTATKPSR